MADAVETPPWACAACKAGTCERHVAGRFHEPQKLPTSRALDPTEQAWQHLTPVQQAMVLRPYGYRDVKPRVRGTYNRLLARLQNLEIFEDFDTHAAYLNEIPKLTEKGRRLQAYGVKLCGLGHGTVVTDTPSYNVGVIAGVVDLVRAAGASIVRDASHYNPFRSQWEHGKWEAFQQSHSMLRAHAFVRLRELGVTHEFYEQTPSFPTTIVKGAAKPDCEGWWRARLDGASQWCCVRVELYNGSDELRFALGAQGWRPLSDVEEWGPRVPMPDDDPPDPRIAVAQDGDDDV